MNRRTSPMFAVGAVLLLVAAGTTVMIPGIDQNRLVPGGGDALSLPSAESNLGEPYELYEELSTYAPSETGYQLSSWGGPRSEDDDRPKTVLHRWLCPICGATKNSFAAENGDPRGAAANNLRSHVRNSGGHGHGPPGTLPTEISPEIIDDHVVVFELSGTR